MFVLILISANVCLWKKTIESSYVPYKLSLRNNKVKEFDLHSFSKETLKGAIILIFV
jgi:hypothetical protein